MNPLGLNTIVAASPGVITPPASAEMAALHRGRVADERQLDSLAGQRLGLAREQCRGGDGRLVVAVDLAAGGVAGLALFERPPAHPPRRFWCKPISRRKPISHRHLPWSNERGVCAIAPRQGVSNNNLAISAIIATNSLFARCEIQEFFTTLAAS